MKFRAQLLFVLRDLLWERRARRYQYRFRPDRWFLAAQQRGRFLERLQWPRGRRRELDQLPW